MKQYGLVLLFPLVASCATPSKSSLDAEVRRLCAIDGGIKVYETVKLPPERFDQWGNFTVLTREKSKAEDEYYSESDTYYYEKGDYEALAMWRSRYRIFRRTDTKLLGESIRYIRRGGDIPGPWHPTSFSCPPISKDQPSLESSIFLKGVEQ